MNETQDLAIFQGDVTDDRAIVVYGEVGIETMMVTKWLEAKASRSAKTRIAYESVIRQFRLQLQDRGFDLFSERRTVSLIASGYVTTSFDRQGRVKDGQLSESTINQRLAILSSFYQYAARYNDRVKSPIDLIDRAARNTHDAAAHLDAQEVETALAGISRKDLAGKRDYALLLLAFTTGRRARELTALTWGDIRLAGKKCEVTWQQCKGNKTMKDILGPKTRAALEEWLHACYGKQLGQLANDAPLFVSLSRNNFGRAMSLQAVSDICFKYLGTGKIHTTRHTFAINNERAGASLAEISERLGHNSQATTSIYLKRLHSAENKHITTLERLYGLS